MISSKALFTLLCLSLLGAAVDAYSQVLTKGGIAPMTQIPSEQWIEKIVGDMDTPGQPFVIRIHHDAGYVVLPHTHPEDENITVLAGSWALGMGSRVNLTELEPMDQGALGFVPKEMAHFGYAKVETILQVHGIGPFVNLPIDPVFELTSRGVLAKPSLLKPGVPTSSGPLECFKLAIGVRMQGERGEGVVVGGLCSPANHFTQYWIKKANGERFWAVLTDLKILR